MASATQNVVRYSALLFGVIYGFSHARTLQKEHDEHSIKHANDRRAALIEEAKKAYAAKKAEASKPGSDLITNPEDPKFDLEKLVESWAQKA